MKTYPTEEDDLVMRSLVHQVSKATPRGGTEQDVITFISLPMWKAFCRATGMPETSKPTKWLGPKDTHRVYGSVTVVVPSKAMFALSRPL